MKKLTPRLLTVALAIAFAGALPTATSFAAAAASTKATPTKFTEVEGITEYRLANGLRVLLAPDASKPTTTVNVTYLVGSRHESYGETGMAHLLEHMLFKGTKTRSNLMQELSQRGMQFNGTTFYDRTNYYETFPANADNLRWALSMEADRMVNSKVAKVDLDTEFSVVRNEMEMGENDPTGVLIKQLSAVSFDWHNYGHETIGARADVEGVKIENLQAFYRKYYQPDNAVLMVAGKFDVAATLAMIQQYFAPLAKPKRQLSPTWTRDGERDGSREVTVRRVADQQIAALLYPVAPGSHSDSAALSALAEVLGATPNGRLHKNLTEQKLAVGVSGFQFQLAEPGFMMFFANLSKEQDIQAAKKALIDTVEGLKDKPVTKAELDLAKSTILNGIEKTINDPEQLCVAMSESIAMGDWRLFYIHRDRIVALKETDLQQVAGNYFKTDNRSYGQFLPVAAPDRSKIPDAPDVQKLVQDYRGKAQVAAGEAFDVSPANIDKRTTKFNLANGAQVSLIAKKNRGETVAGQINLRLGDVDSLRAQHLPSALAASLLLRGTSKQSRADLDARLAQLKAHLSIVGSGQNVVIQFDTMRAQLPEFLQLLQEVLQQPAFDAKEFDLLIKENLAALEASRNEPQAAAQEYLKGLRNTAYQADDIRYSLPLDQAIAGYKTVQLEQVKQFYQTFYGANYAQFSLVGDFDETAVKAQLSQAFGKWSAQQNYQRLVPIAVPTKAMQQQVATPDKANAVYLGRQNFSMNDQHPDYPALVVANQVLGGGIKSRLFNRLRQQEGISYGAGSGISVPALDQEAGLNLYAIFAPQNLDKLKKGVAEEFARFIRDGITAQELKEAKQALEQEAQVYRAQDPVLSNLLVSQLFLKRSMKEIAEHEAKIAAINLEQVNQAIKKYFKPEMLTEVYAGDFNKK